MTGETRTARTESKDLRLVPEFRESRTRVLIVDDHVLFAEGLEAALQERGLEVVGIATRGREAVTLAGREQPDFVLIDVDLPDMDGVTVGRRILADHPEIKLMAVTGLHDAGLVREAIRAGFQGFVMKESSISELMASMTAVARTHAVIPHEAAKTLAGMRSKQQDADLLSRHLTEREREVLSLLVAGASSKQLAERLHLSPNTIRTHIQNICFKLQVHSRLEAVAFAVRYAIVRVRPADGEAHPGDSGLPRAQRSERRAPDGRRTVALAMDDDTPRPVARPAGP